MAIEVVGPYAPAVVQLAREFEPFNIVCRSCTTELRVTEPADMHYVRHTDYGGDTSTYLDINCPLCGSAVSVEHYNGRDGHPVMIVNALISEGLGHLVNTSIPAAVRRELWTSYVEGPGQR